MRRLLQFLSIALVLVGLLWCAHELRDTGARGTRVVLEGREEPLPLRANEPAPALARVPVELATTPIADAQASPSSVVELPELLVSDDLGRPVVGLPVGIYHEEHCMGPTSQVARSDRDGLVRMSLGKRQWTRLGRQEASLWLAVSAPIGRRERLQLELGAHIEEPLRLRVGPTGGLLVRFDPQGLEIDALHVEVGTVREPGQSAASTEFPDVEHELDGMELLLPHVALGIELALRVRTGANQDLGRFVVKGPVVRDEIVAVELALAPTAPRVRVRLVDPGGAPLAKLELTGKLRVGEATIGRIRGTSDDAGLLAFDGPAYGPTHGPAQTDEAEVTLDAFPQPLSGSARVPRGAPGETIELGNLVLAPPALLAAGHVLSESGEPIRFARVEALTAAVGSSSAEDWTTIARASTWSDANGRFELRGRAPEGALALRAEAGGRLAIELQRIEPGATDVVLRLATTGAIYGWIMYEEWLPASALSLELTDLSWTEEHPEGPRPVHRKKTWEDGFSFIGAGLPPGVATVRVMLQGDDEALAVIPYIEVPTGGMSYDDRVQGIDLTGLIRRHTIEIVDAHGAAVPVGRIGFQASLGTGARGSFMFSEGRAKLVSRAAVLDLCIGAPGFRTRTVEGVAGHARVSLESGLRVQLELASEVGLREGESLWVGLLPPESGREEGRFFELRFQFTEEAAIGEFLAPGPGAYTLQWEHRPSGELLPDGSAPIVVLDREQAQPFQVRPDPAAREAARR